MTLAASFIRLRLTDEGDSTGMLTAEGRAGHFAGEGTACFRIADLEEFAESIGEYPLSAKSRIEVCGGYFSSTTPPTLDQEHLALCVYPTDRRGSVAIQVRVATSWHAGQRPESQFRAAFEVDVTCEALRVFSRDLIALLRGKIPEATIEGFR